MQGDCGDTVDLAASLQFGVSSDAADEVDARVSLDVFDSEDLLQDQIGDDLRVQTRHRRALVDAVLLDLHLVPPACQVKAKLVAVVHFRCLTLFALSDNKVF